MGDLYNYFHDNPGRFITKWRHYFGIYERHFGAYRNRPIRLIEFGVFHGGSLQMWKHYFGAQAEIIGVDINPDCARLSEPGIEIVIGDQADRALHAQLRERYGEFDIVIDDGGHTMTQQIVTFQELYPAVKAGGVYLAEDLHTSYHADWGGGARKPGTFIEFSKALIDQLHAWYGPPAGVQIDYVTHTAYGLHFYDSIFVVEKQPIARPARLASGKPSFALIPVEILLLAEHDLRKGDKRAALEKYRELARIAPRDESFRQMIDQLQAEIGPPAAA